MVEACRGDGVGVVPGVRAAAAPAIPARIAASSSSSLSSSSKSLRFASAGAGTGAGTGTAFLRSREVSSSVLVFGPALRWAASAARTRAFSASEAAREYPEGISNAAALVRGDGPGELVAADAAVRGEGPGDIVAAFTATSSSSSSSSSSLSSSSSESNSAAVGGGGVRASASAFPIPPEGTTVGGSGSRTSVPAFSSPSEGIPDRSVPARAARAPGGAFTGGDQAALTALPFVSWLYSVTLSLAASFTSRARAQGPFTRALCSPSHRTSFNWIHGE